MSWSQKWRLCPGDGKLVYVLPRNGVYVLVYVLEMKSSFMFSFAPLAPLAPLAPTTAHLFHMGHLIGHLMGH